MNIWTYDRGTGGLIAQQVAESNPLEAGEFLIPAFATDQAPPSAPAGQYPAFQGGVWVLVPDHRGETWWRGLGDPVTVMTIGDPASFSPPLLASEPAATTDELRGHLADKRWQVETGGITWNAMPIATDDRAKTLIEGAASSLGDTDSVKFKVAAGTWVDVTGAQLRAIRDAIAAHVQACFAKEAELDAAISAGTITTTAEIDAAAWPT